MGLTIGITHSDQDFEPFRGKSSVCPLVSDPKLTGPLKKSGRTVGGNVNLRGLEVHPYSLSSSRSHFHSSTKGTLVNLLYLTPSPFTKSQDNKVGRRNETQRRSEDLKEI